MDIKILTDFELFIMSVLFENCQGENDVSVQQMIDMIEEKKNIRYARTTISTYMGYLVKMGFIASRKAGVVYYYRPLITREEFLKLLNTDYLNFWYDGKISKLAGLMIEEGQLSKNDLKRMTDF